MGGDGAPSLISSSEVESLWERGLPEFWFQSATNLRDVSIVKEDGDANGENGESYGDVMAHQISLRASDFDCERRTGFCREILEGYYEMQPHIENLEVAKSKILSYHPGAWIENVGGMKKSDFDVPNSTTLLLVGPKGSGKSSLINRISMVFEDDIYAPERAQVSYNCSPGDGTHFLHEYVIPKGSTSFCLYDTRSLSEDSSENMQMLKRWMTQGVRHGELVIRDSDGTSLKDMMKIKARQSGYFCSEIRMVNFVIFVVNGLSLLRSMEGDDKAKLDTDIVVTTFNFPFLSFRDDKPVVVLTHGDLLSRSDRAKVRLYLGDLLGIPPTKQVFDIPENHDPATQLEALNMLRYCLEHADKNFRGKGITPSKALKAYVLKWLLVLGIAIMAAYLSRIMPRHVHKHRAPPSNPRLDWHSVRHLWLGVDYD